MQSGHAPFFRSSEPTGEGFAEAITAEKRGHPAVARIGTAGRPAGRDGSYFNDSHAEAIVDLLRAAGSNEFIAIGGPMAFEEDLVKLLVETGADPENVETLHYNEEKSQNPEAFAEALVGLLYGCIDPGDEHILDLLAECGLEPAPSGQNLMTVGRIPRAHSVRPARARV